MGLTVRQVVESLATYGIMSASDVEALREKAQAELDQDAEPWLQELVRQNKLTNFQAANLNAGKAKALVFGEYLILDRIGAGGMGQVYKAQHRKMKRIVALKVLPPKSVGSPRAVQRFYQEVEVAAKLTHPNIVTAYDAGEAHGMLYLVMEFVDGKDLSSHVNKHGPLSLEQTLNVILHAARGLAYAHSLGIIHRDVKPSNLLIGRDKSVKILDMGLARAANPIGETGPVGAELTASGEVMGTVDYMPPEQAADTRTADHRADIYALGCSLHRIYIGRAPYGGETAVQKILAHRDQPIPSLQAQRPETPDAVERLFRKMLAKNADERTQTMAAVVQSIENLLAGVAEEQSSVVLGNELPEDGVGPSGANLGGRRPSGSTIGGAATPDVHPGLPQVAAANRPGAADAETFGATRHGSSSTTARKTTGAQSRQQAVLLAGGLGVLAVAAAVAYFVLGNKPEDATPSAAVTLIPPSTSGSRPVGVPSPSGAATPRPLATNMFELPPSTPTPSDDDPPTPTPPSFNTPNPPTPTPPTPSPSPTAPPPPAVVPTKQEELIGEIDLLARIEPQRHARHGKWIRQGTEIETSTGQGNDARFLDVPFVPPPEYDLTCIAVPGPTTNVFGPGLAVAGRPLSVHLSRNKFGLAMIDGQNAFQSGNPAYRQGDYFVDEQPVTIVCAVRQGRVVVTVNFKRVADVDLTADRIGAEDPNSVTPGQLFLRGSRGVRFTALKIGPPTISLTPPPAAVNLAAAFDQANVAAGTAATRRGEILLTAPLNTYAKLQFQFPRAESYVLRAVVERGSLGGALALSLPLTQQRRTAAVVDYSDIRFVGMHFVGPGPVDINPTGRRAGMLLTPGELHVFTVRAEPVGSNVHFQVEVDGREWVNYTADGFGWDGNLDVPDLNAVGLSHYSGNLRILRFDQLPADGRRPPIPDVKAREAVMAVVRGLAGEAEGTKTPLDEKLLAVDMLRKKAATELENAALRYELLDAASRIAAAAGDLGGAYEAVEDMTTAFEVDDAAYHSRILETFKTPRTAVAAKQQFAEEAIKLTLRAARSEQFQLANDLNAAVEKLLVTANADVKREVKARAAEYELALSLQPAAKEARAKLKVAANDGAARAALGMYLGCALNDWPAAVKEWAKCDDAGLQVIAALEQGDMTSGDAKFALAEKWLEMSDKEKTPGVKWCYAERAAYWYRRAAINVSDVKRPAIGRQMAKIAQLRKTSNGAGGPRRPLDAVKIGDHWYQLFPLAMHADTALTTCENLGGNLLVLDNVVESQAVGQFLLQRLSAVGADGTHVWLGIHDVDKEGTFRRIDGVPMVPPAFINWAEGEPNNLNGDEDHVAWEVAYADGQIVTAWRDANRVIGGKYVICEWDH